MKNEDEPTDTPTPSPAPTPTPTPTPASRGPGSNSAAIPTKKADDFAGSIRRLWDRLRTERLAGTLVIVLHFVRSLPDGYDAVIDADAGNLSSGEKQLITIARAFVADPEILILDEATSSVDTRTEVLVQQAMAALRSARTSFVIAHRLSTIRNADEILVLDAGRIIERGDHDGLLANRGPYFDLYNAQFAAVTDEEDVALVASTS